MKQLTNDKNDFYIVVASLVLCPMIAFANSESRSCLSYWADAVKNGRVSDDSLYSVLSQQCKPETAIRPATALKYTTNEYHLVMSALKASLEHTFGLKDRLDFKTIDEGRELRGRIVDYAGSKKWAEKGLAIGKIFAREYDNDCHRPQINTDTISRKNETNRSSTKIKHSHKIKVKHGSYQLKVIIGVEKADGILSEVGSSIFLLAGPTGTLNHVEVFSIAAGPHQSPNLTYYEQGLKLRKFLNPGGGADVVSGSGKTSAHEEGNVHNLKSQQLQELKKHLADEAQFHEDEIRRHQQALDYVKKFQKFIFPSV